MKSLPYFAFLILVAVMIYLKLHLIAVVAFGLWAFFFAYWWLSERYPRTMITLTWLFLGMISGGRWRR